MKTARLLAIFMLMFGISAMAQEEPGPDFRDKKEQRDKLSPEEKADKRTDKMTEVLGLSEEQSVEIKKINLEHIKEMDKIKKEIKALKKQAKEARDKTRKDIESVLDADQIEKMKEEEDKHRKKREEKRRERCCQGK